MLGTHTPKLLNARVKQPALRARASAAVPKHLVCSATTRMRRELWALPLNAADMAQERRQLAEDALPAVSDAVIPRLRDGNIKQVLLPTGRPADYIATSPVISCGVGHEMYQRLAEAALPYWPWVIQPTPAARANHGEMLMLQSGGVRLLRRGIRRVPRSAHGRRYPHGALVQLTARVEAANINGGMLSVGAPAITAVGGAVHALERQVGQDLDFAIGLTKLQWHNSAQKTTNYGRGMHSRAHLPAIAAEEMTGAGPIVLLLRPRSGAANLEEIAEAASGLARLAGGCLLDVDVGPLSPDDPVAPARWIADASDQVRWHLDRAGATDALHAILAMYGAGGHWGDDEQWRQAHNTFSASMTGYAFLGPVSPDPLARGGYPFAWSEGVYAATRQSAFPSWWVRDTQDWGVYWRGA